MFGPSHSGARDSFPLTTRSPGGRLSTTRPNDAPPLMARINSGWILGYYRPGGFYSVPAGHVPYSQVKDAAGYRAARAARAALAAFQAKRDKRRAIIVARLKSTFPARGVSK